MDFLYAPWRKQYVEQEKRGKHENTQKDECVFCSQFAEHKDEQNFILRRFDSFFIMLNRFPYNGGHLLIVASEHVPMLNDFTKQQRAELIELANQSINIVQRELKAEGVNTGINLGKSAGAGIPSHFHQHILPRWRGDTNFLPTLADTKQISVDLHQMYQQLKPLFDDIAVN